jgi:hypothetical protein
VIQAAMVAVVVLLSLLLYAFSPKEDKVINQPQKSEANIRHLFYGSGHDKRRPEYADNTLLKTPTVDATHLITNWTGFHGYVRTGFWGFGPDSLPLNGRVWYVPGEGKKPLVLIAHGNHLDQDFSDGGFEYLGKHLAAHGFIVASVDENFLNSSWAELAEGIQGDIPARAWLLLKHLEVWNQWKSSPGHPFYEQVDMNRIALIGHSRGGEAVTWAHYLNKLPYEYNKPGQLKKEKFNINSIISITPTDGYLARENGLLPLSDVNYLQIQSGRDMDLLYHSGQYERVHFTGNHRYLKAKLVFTNGNHNGFNTQWGSYDVMFPNSLFADIGEVMPASAQQEAAQKAVLTFLQNSFEGGNTYLDWYKRQSLPGQVHYSDAINIATFEEDRNLRSGTYSYSFVSAQGFSQWEEKELFATERISQGRALHLSWGSTSREASAVLRIDSLNILSDKACLTLDIFLEQPLSKAELFVEVIDREGKKSLYPIDLQKNIKATLEKSKSGFSLFPKAEFPPKVFQTVMVPLRVQSISSLQLIIKAPKQGSLWLDAIQLQQL